MPANVYYHLLSVYDNDELYLICKSYMYEMENKSQMFTEKIGKA